MEKSITAEVVVTFKHPVGPSKYDATFRERGFVRFTSSEQRSSGDLVLTGSLLFSSQQRADQFRLRYIQNPRNFPNVKSIALDKCQSSLSRSAFLFSSAPMQINELKTLLGRVSGLSAFKPIFCDPCICQSSEVQFITEVAKQKFIQDVESKLIPNIVKAISKDKWITCQTCGRSLEPSEKCCNENTRLMEPLFVSDEMRRTVCSGWTTVPFEQIHSNLSQTANSQNVARTLCDAFNDPSKFVPGLAIFPFVTSPFRVRAHCLASIISMLQLVDPHSYFKQPEEDMAQVLHALLDTVDVGPDFKKPETIRTFIPALGNFISGTPDSTYRGMPVELKTINNWETIRKKLPKWLRQIACYQLGSNTEAFLVIANRSTKEITCLEVSLENIQTANEFWHEAISTNAIVAENLEITREYDERLSAHLEEGGDSACTAFRDVLPRLERIFQSRVCELDQDPRNVAFSQNCLKRLETMKHFYRE
jgi:hypothetical protein